MVYWLSLLTDTYSMSIARVHILLLFALQVQTLKYWPGYQMRPKFLCSAIIVLLTACLFTSCQKELSVDDSTGTPGGGGSTTNTGLPKTMTEMLIVDGDTALNIKYNLTYDAQNRLTLMQSTLNPGDKMVFAYKPSMYTLTAYGSNTMTIYAEYYLAANNTVDSSMQYNDTKDTATEKCSYNAKGQLTSVSQYEYSAALGSVLSEKTLYTYDAKGNVVSEQNSRSGTTTYTYYDNLKTPFNILGPYQQLNPNLAKTATKSGEVINYTYLFDSKGRLTDKEGKGSTIVADYSTIVKYTY